MNVQRQQLPCTPALLRATQAPPCATESGTPGSQNSSSTCTGGGGVFPQLGPCFVLKRLQLPALFKEEEL